MSNDKNQDYLEAALTRFSQAPQDNQASVTRVLARLSGPLPRQKMPFWRLPSVLLDWQFAPAWPRMAALAFCAAAGFYIGITGLDRPFDRLEAPFAVASGADLGTMVFAPEPLTGARP
jgi:hypothetical protein